VRRLTDETFLRQISCAIVRAGLLPGVATTTMLRRQTRCPVSELKHVDGSS